jgi:hypothetical protein
MAVSSSLHFVGKEAVLEAYHNRQVIAWSLWQNRQFLTKGMSAAELDIFLDSLWSESTAIYTLKVYEDITEPKEIKEKTPCDGSFNFRLREREEPYVNGGRNYSSRGDDRKYEELEAKMNLILERLDGDEVEEEETTDTLGAIGKFVGSLFNDPDKFEKTLGVIKQLMQPQPTAIGNVNMIDAGNASLSPSSIQPMQTNTTQQNAPVKKELNQEELTRLYTAIETLQANDRDIVQHMEKLAQIAVNSPAQFKTLIGMLDVF